MTEKLWVYVLIPGPGDQIHFVAKKRASKPDTWDAEYLQWWNAKGGRVFTYQRLHDHNEVIVRADYGPYCVVDLTDQPDDADPRLVGKSITERAALQHIRKHYKDHVEHTAGLEYDNLHMIDDLADIHQAIAAEVVALAKLNSRPQVENRLGPVLTRIKNVQNTADRRKGFKLILELLIDQVTGFEETTETLLHLVVRRARVLIEHIRKESFKAAFAQVRTDRGEPSLNVDRLLETYPDDVLNAHRTKFQEMLRQWQVYIRRDDFETITRLRQKGWHWTAAALAQHVREFAAADAAAESEGT